MSFRSFVTLGLLFVSSVCGASAALAGTSWKQVSLRAADGSRIEINYELQEVVRRNMRAVIAAPLWVNVTRPSSSRLNAVFMNFEGGFHKRDQARLVSHSELNFSRANRGARFDVEVKGGVLAGICKGYDCSEHFQEIAIVDESGNWLLDPISMSHNFRFRLF